MFIKTIKIFLCLKWDETIGVIQWREGAAKSVAFSIILMFFWVIIYGLGYICCALRAGEKGGIGETMAMGVVALALIGVLIIIIIGIIKLCKWLASNWRRAKEMAKHAKNNN